MTSPKAPNLSKFRAAPPTKQPGLCGMEHLVYGENPVELRFVMFSFDPFIAKQTIWR